MNLQLQDIKKAYGGKEVLKGCSFTFEKGKIYGLLGRNGAGKTTLFNCLTDELPADSGTAELIEETGARRPLVPSEVGYVFSTPILPDFLTGYEFIKFYMDINAARCTPGKTIDDYFDMVQIDAQDRHKLIKGYSHGMKNKVQMLLFLIARPPVILLDEPLTSFDVVVALEIKTFCGKLSTTMSLCSPPIFCSLPQTCVTKSSFCMTASSARWTMRFCKAKILKSRLSSC